MNTQTKHTVPVRVITAIVEVMLKIIKGHLDNLQQLLVQMGNLKIHFTTKPLMNLIDS